MTLVDIALTCAFALLFGMMCGAVMGWLCMKSQPTDIAGAVARGLVAAGAAIVGFFAVVGVVVLLADKIETVHPNGSPSMTQTTTAPAVPIDASTGRR